MRPDGLPRRRTCPHPHESFRAAWGPIRDAASAHRRRLRRADAGGHPGGPHQPNRCCHHIGAARRPAEIRSWERSLPVLAHDLMPGRPRQRRGARRAPAAADQQARRRGPGRRAPADRRRRRTSSSSSSSGAQRRPTRTTHGSSSSTGTATRPRCTPSRRCAATASTCSTSPASCTRRPETRRRRGLPAQRDGRPTSTTCYDYPARRRWAASSPASAAASFIDFLRTRLDPTVPGAPYADQLLTSRIAPSKQLLAVAAEEIRDREQFVLLARAARGVRRVLHAVERARRAGHASRS